MDATRVVGKTDADLLPKHAADILTDIKRRVLESGKGTRQKIQTIVDGKPLVFDLAVEPLRDTAGAIIGITGVSTDIIDRNIRKGVDTEGKNTPPEKEGDAP